jgi:hypothetical protein
MNEDDRLRKTCAAGAPGCSLWKPIIPLSDAVADGQVANAASLHDAPAGSEAFLLEDPEGIEGRLAAA